MFTEHRKKCLPVSSKAGFIPAILRCATQTRTAQSCTEQCQSKLCGSSPMFAKDTLCTRTFLIVLYFAYLACVLSKTLSKLNAPTHKFSFDLPTKFGLCLFTRVCAQCGTYCNPDRSPRAIPHIFIHTETARCRVVQLVLTRHNNVTKAEINQLS